MSHLIAKIVNLKSTGVGRIVENNKKMYSTLLIPGKKLKTAQHCFIQILFFTV